MWFALTDRMQWKMAKYENMIASISYIFHSFRCHSVGNPGHKERPCGKEPMHSSQNSSWVPGWQPSLCVNYLSKCFYKSNGFKPLDHHSSIWYHMQQRNHLTEPSLGTEFWVIINGYYCAKPPSFGVVCYTVIDNQSIHYL